MGKQLIDTIPDGFFMCFDPGIDGTGWANFIKGRHEPISYGVIHGKDFGLYRTGKVIGIADRARTLMQAIRPKMVVIETPELFGGARGHASAARGDVFIVAQVVGALMLAAFDAKLATTWVQLVSPADWKGQMDNHAVAARIARCLGPEYHYPEHTREAVGMGLAVRGLL